MKALIVRNAVALLTAGAALVTAFRTLFARGCDAVVTLDADGQHLPEEIPKLLEAARGGADLVLGTREELRTRCFTEMKVVDDGCRHDGQTRSCPLPGAEIPRTPNRASSSPTVSVVGSSRVAGCGRGTGGVQWEDER